MAAAAPPALVPGARVAVIAPSSGTLERSQVRRGLAVLEQMGLEPVLGPHLWKIRGHLAGSDRERAADLVWALAAPDIDAVWAARGGYGAQRTVATLSSESLDRITAAAPRAFIGYSDLTVVHALISRRLGWISFYGPTVSDLGRATDYTCAGLAAALFDAAPFQIGPAPDDDFITTVVPGRAQGRLAGGCLTLLAALAGTDLAVHFDGAVAFFEDVGESPARVERYLSQLLAAGCFTGVVAIAVGEHVDAAPRSANSLGLEQVILDLLAPLGVPLCHFLPVGHGRHQATVPIGAAALLDADRGVLEIPQAPVLSR